MNHLILPPYHFIGVDYGITAEQSRPLFCFTASAEVAIAKKPGTAYRTALPPFFRFSASAKVITAEVYGHLSFLANTIFPPLLVLPPKTLCSFFFFSPPASGEVVKFISEKNAKPPYPQTNYRRMAIPPHKSPPYFGFTASGDIVAYNLQPPTVENITAVWHHRPVCTYLTNK